jgi:transposase
MVWGAVAHGKKWDLVRLSIPPSEVQEKGKGMNGEKYIRMVLNGPLKRAARQLKTARWRDILVVEDGAPCHTCKLAKEARSKLGIPSLIHPPSSPDLNPIENVWHLLKTKVSQLPTQATNLDMLWCYSIRGTRTKRPRRAVLQGPPMGVPVRSISRTPPM